MFSWGAGPSLGVLTLVGYAIWLAGALTMWRNRAEFVFWVDEELSTLRRNFSRYVPAGPFYERRGESRLRVIPAGFVHSVSKLPRRRFSWGAFLLFLGFSLFILDFFI